MSNLKKTYKRRPKAIAADTLQIMEQGSYKNKNGNTINIASLLDHSLSGTQLYTPEELAYITSGNNDKYETIYEVNNETTLDAVRRLVADGEQQVLCLNFASAKNPGGGFLGGAVAQEESIARASGLYPTLLKGEAYYTFHRGLGTCLYSDHMIYSPDVPVFKYENGELMDEAICVSVITSPAANAGAIHRNEPDNKSLIEPVMRIRTEKVLALSAQQGHEVLVLGAWGCGVFRNDPEMIAGLFEELLKRKFKGTFKKIVFAVKTKSEPMLEAFSRRFK